jgi:PAS domain S-box-containing protein
MNKTKNELIEEIKYLKKYVSYLEKIKKLQKQSEEQMVRASAVVHNSNDAITVQKTDGTILDWNRGAELIYGWTVSEAVGENITMIIPEDKLAEKNEMRNRIIKGETVLSFETKRTAKDGSILDIWLTLGALTDDNGKVNAISTIERNITERKKAEILLKDSEAKLREQKITLEQKNAALKELLEHIEVEKKIMKDKIHANVENLLLPLLKKISLQKGMNNKYLDLLEHNLKELTSSFGIKIADPYLRLSPREVEICSMVKSGFTSKEISDTLDVTYKTIERHRNNIRKKLGLVSKGINLVTFLQSQGSSDQA